MTLQRRLLAVSRRVRFAGLLAVLSCSKTVLTEPIFTDIEGDWINNGLRHQLPCVPSALPAAIDADSSRYVQIPGSSFSLSEGARITQAGRQLTVVPLDALGREQTAHALQGSIDGLGESVVSGSWELLVEGPREGGHTFQVSETVVDSGRYSRDILLPPGKGPGEASRQASIWRTFVFRDGGSAGPIYTTCVVADTIIGRRQSQL